MRRILSPLLLVTVMAVLVISCGGGGDEPSTNVTPSIDSVPPTVVSTIPADEATGVEVNSAIFATFSEVMDISTITPATFTLNSKGANISGKVTYSDTTAVFTPSSALAPDTTYTVTLTTGVKDMAGNAMAANHTWSFTTGAAPNDTVAPTIDDTVAPTITNDTVAPTITVVVPQNGAINVPINTAVTATFSEAMDASTLDAASALLIRGKVEVARYVSYDSTSRTITLTPSTALASTTFYRVIITTAVKDLAGNTLTADYTWSFTTADVVPPTVIFVSPVNGVTKVSIIGPTIAATFSEMIDSTTINDTSFTLTSGDGSSITGAVSYDNKRGATFTPSANLVPETTYTAAITTVVKDISGNAMDNNYMWSFTTTPWIETSRTNAPLERGSHTAIWTGTEMIVWGGLHSGTYVVGGGRYNPATDTWTAISTTNTPLTRSDHTAIWTGTEMIVWGGLRGGSYLDSGDKYNPATDTWTAISTTNVPLERGSHTAIWTGTEMIVWGGYDGLQYVNIGGRYDPATDTWTAISTTNAPSARRNHTATWTDTEMIVWGGYDSFGASNTGGRYDPATDTWVATSTANAPSARFWHTAVWTGTETIVWGGIDNFGNALESGSRYHPATNSWSAVQCTDTVKYR